MLLGIPAPIFGADDRREIIFVVVVSGTATPYLLTSADGIRWVKRLHAGNNPYYLCYGKGKFVGAAPGIVNASQRIAWSNDGFKWQAPANNLIDASSITFANDLFFVTVRSGPPAGLYSSSDAVTWNTLTIPIYPDAVCYGTLWVAASGDGSMATSTNATTWTKRTSSFGTTAINALAYGGGVYVAAGDTGKIASSTNGTSWTQRTSGFGTSRIARLAYGAGIFVAVGSDGKVSTSPNGTAWTARGIIFEGNPINAIAFAKGLFVAVGSFGNIATSPDGITWTQRVSGITAPINDITAKV